VKLKSSFQARIACVLILLLLVVVAALTLAVKVATNDAVRGQAAEQLEVGTRVFERLLDVRGRRLRDGLQLLSADFGFRDAVASGDSPTIRSALLNHGARIGASDMFVLGMDGKVVSSTDDNVAIDTPFIYDQALRAARRNHQSMLIVPLAGLPHLLVEAQVLAPLPIARVVMGFTMDSAFAQELHSLSNLQVSFLTQTPEGVGQLVSTQAPPLHASISEWLQTNKEGRRVSLAVHEQQSYLNEPLLLANDSEGGGKVIALLQSPLDDAMKAFAPLDQNIFYIALGALLASLAGALLLARGVSQPVKQLAQAAERIGQGDYQTPVTLQRSDELGALADRPVRRCAGRGDQSDAGRHRRARAAVGA
jgi:HAMP domain-containing protein